MTYDCYSSAAELHYFAASAKTCGNCKPTEERFHWYRKVTYNTAVYKIVNGSITHKKYQSGLDSTRVRSLTIPIGLWCRRKHKAALPSRCDLLYIVKVAIHRSCGKKCA